MFGKFLYSLKIMEGKSIQLWFGVVSENNPENELQFNFPPNFRKDILFEKLLYLRHAKNPALNDIIKNGIVDSLELQNIFLQLVYYKMKYSKVWT